MLKNKKLKSIETIIGKDTVIEGKLTLPTSLRIDGKVIGEIFCEGDVYIGKSASVEPFISARNIMIAGSVKGEIVASEKVKIEANGMITGNISSKGVIIDDGGVFIGSSSLTENDNVSKTKELILTNE